MRTTLLRALALMATVALGSGLAACGGDDEPVAVDVWSRDFCTALTTWQDDIEGFGAIFSEFEEISEQFGQEFDALDEEYGDATAPLEEAFEEEPACAEL